MDLASVTVELRRAAQLQLSGELDAAAGICARLIDEFPQEADATHLLGIIRKQQRRYSEAEQLLRASVDLDPRRAEYQANLANLLVVVGQMPQAEFVYRTALDLERDFRPARLGLARLLNRAGKFAAAGREARELITRDPRDAEAFAILGRSLSGRGQTLQAEAAYREALTIRPGYGVARHSLGTLLAGQHRPAEALEQFETAAAAGVHGPDIGVERARALLMLDRLEEAKARLQSTIDDCPGAAEPRELLARIRYLAERPDFDAGLREAADEQPDNVRLQRAHAAVLRDAGRTEAAADRLATTMMATAPHPRLLAELADVHLQAGRFEQALDAARHACALDSATPAWNDRVVDALLSLGRADEAMPLIDAARALAPHDQRHIACEALAARLLRDPRYERLYDYERLIQTFAPTTPEGWDDLSAFNADLAAALAAKRGLRGTPLNRRMRNATATPFSLTADAEPTIRAFRETLSVPIAAYRDRIGTDPEHPLSARNHGAVTLGRARCFHVERDGCLFNDVHAQGWLSAIYYVVVPSAVAAGSGRLRFGEPRYPVPGVGAAHSIQPEAGMLVLFPSYLWHGSAPVSDPAPWLSIAFDVIPERPHDG